MKIVVTGALGHIGSRLIRELPADFANAEVVMVDNLSTQRYASLFHLPRESKYRFIEADVLTASLENIFLGADVVIHLAAITNASASFEIKERVRQVNYGATEKVARACVKTGCPMFYVSSTSVYGTQKQAVDEDCPNSDLRPQSPYAESKLEEERLLETLGKSGGLRFIICRFGTIFGTSPGMRFHTAINKFCWQALMKKPLTVWSTAFNQVRPYLYISDAVEAVKFVIKEDLFDCKLYNVLTANSTVSNIVEIIKTHLPDLTIQYVDTEIMNQLSYNVSNNRFKSHGFKFNGSLEKGISETIQLLKSANCGFQMSN
jgi:nucleoside-diphosphate-sugar epimerase